MNYLFNTTIATGPGTWVVEEISLERAKSILGDDPATSAIGHEGTAQVMSTLLGRPVEVNRIFAKLQPGDAAICLKVNGRLPEGSILTKKELEGIGYTFYSMKLL